MKSTFLWGPRSHWGAAAAVLVFPLLAVTGEATDLDGMNTAEASAAMSGDAKACSREQEAANKKVIESIKPSPDGLYEAMHPDYVQHNPELLRFGELNGVNPREAFKLMGEANARLGAGPRTPPPDQPRGNPRYMVLAECDKVMVVMTRYLPDPQNQGKYFETFGLEVYRIKDGKLYEHWDAALIPNPVPEYLKTPVKDLKPK